MLDNFEAPRDFAALRSMITELHNARKLIFTKCFM